ncbi:MAG: hypothetical protein R3208_13090 [Ketobacteraceae bacterium]|nr:hypothetical protein [Ketobacteraceae bacterium]
MLRKGILLGLLMAGCANAAVFQKVTNEATITRDDVSQCALLGDGDLSVVFNEQGQEKLAQVLNEDNTKVNLVVDGHLLMTLAVPRAMDKLDKFKVTVDRDGMLATEWGCQPSAPEAPTFRIE